MPVLLALASALSFGSGDFLGGMATRRGSATAVVTWSYALSGLLLLVASLATGGTVTGGDLALGAGAGVLGAGGIVLLYRALAIGQMSAIAPVTALLAAAVPVAVGLGQGEQPGWRAAVGMVVAVAAVVLVSAEGGGSLRPADRRGVALALGAGLLFGCFFVGISLTDDGSGLWPLLAARVASLVLLGALAAVGRVRAARPRGRAGWATAGAGVFDGAGNVLYLLAIREGLLTVGTVLSSLYPVATVVLAWLVLRERFAPVQRAGMLLAIPAAILLAL